MSENKEKITIEEENSFFDNEYRKYTGTHTADSCATGSITLNDLTGIYGIENTRMLKDYETASLRMTHLTRTIQDNTDRKIENLRGHEEDEIRSDYEFDADELTIGEIIAINEEILKKQKELSERPEEPYLSGMIAAFPGEHTERISVISVPNEAIASDESPFISVDEIIDN